MLKRKKSFILFLFIGLCFLGTEVNAQNEETTSTWCLITDQQEVVALSEVNYMLQRDSKLNLFDIVLHNGTIVSDVRNITFDQRNISSPTKINAQENAPRLFQVDDLLTLSHIKANAWVHIADVSGRTWQSVQANENGVARLSVATYPTGVYLLTVGNTSIKFFKK